MSILSSSKNTTHLEKPKSALGGSMMVAGAAIGAGMFSLPVVSAGMWFPWTAVSLLLVWLISYMAALLILETNLIYPPGTSFSTFVADTLGKSWNILTGVSLVFLLYILLYAYFSAGGSIVNHTLTSIFSIEVEFSSSKMSIFFGLAIAISVWIGTALVSRLSVILIISMVVTFLMSNSGLFMHAELTKLLNRNDRAISYYIPFIWAALPYYLTSFGYASLVPSLVKYYGREPLKIRSCLLYGSLIALAFYLLWIFVVFGNISRTDFVPVIQAGGNISDLVGALEGGSYSESTKYLLNVFSNFAIISSCLGAGLCLFDYLSDIFKLDNTPNGRLINACITFIPPGIFSFLYPDGFVLAIGYAGLTLYFGYYLIPVLMAWCNRKRFPNLPYRVGGANIALVLVLGTSTTIATCHLLAIFGILKVYH